MVSVLFSVYLKHFLAKCFNDFYLPKKKKKGFPLFQFFKKRVREKSRECHNHKPQPLPDVVIIKFSTCSIFRNIINI